MTLAVKDATGAIQNIPFPNGNGQAPMAASAPVVIASDQVVAISAVSLPLAIGAATAAGQSATHGTVTAGSAPASTSVAGAVYNVTAPVLATGQSAALQSDSSGNLKVSIAAGAGGTPTGPAGAPNASVVSIQGISGATAVPVSLAALPAGSNTLGTVLGPLPSTPITGQQSLTTSAVALPAHVLVNGLIVTALAGNSGTVYVGAGGVTPTTGYPLTAGQSISFGVANSSGISIIGTNATDKVAYAGN